MAEPSYFLFDGYNLLHAAGLERREELVDRLAGWVALRGARGVLVFDGVGDVEQLGPLEVRFAVPADHLIERLAAEHREREVVCLVSSDNAIRGTVGQTVRKVSSEGFARELAVEPVAPPAPAQRERTRVEDALDETTRSRLDRFRRRRN